MANKSSSENQGQLALELCYPQRAAPICSHYKFVKNGLLESFGQRYILYGQSHELFSCWMIDNRHAKSSGRELLPDWPVVIEPKQYHKASQISVLHHLIEPVPRQIILGAKANFWFASYLQSIPSLFQKLAAPFGDNQWLALDLCHQIPGFLRFLHSERFLNRFGYVATCFAMIRSSGDTSRTSRAMFGNAIMLNRRREVLKKFLNREISNSEVRIIEKLSAEVSENDILRTLDSLARDEVAKTLRHADLIPSELLDAAEFLPKGFVHYNLSNLVSNLISNRFSVTHIKRLFNRATVNLTAEQIEQAGVSFSAVRQFSELYEWATKWAEKGAESVAFPPAPIQVEPPLRPISNFLELKAEGLSMKNCVASFWNEVASGEMYFCHWGGVEQASVSFISTPAGNWRFQEALGFKNHELGGNEITKIMSRVIL